MWEIEIPIEKTLTKKKKTILSKLPYLLIMTYLKVACATSHTQIKYGTCFIVVVVTKRNNIRFFPLFFFSFVFLSIFETFYLHMEFSIFWSYLHVKSNDLRKTFNISDFKYEGGHFSFLLSSSILFFFHSWIKLNWEIQFTYGNLDWISAKSFFF